ncbi:MAG: hypothetical protein II393_01625 [Cytophagales bacterium]|nr:hypothetical protein [Cytophagales bacterium]
MKPSGEVSSKKYLVNSHKVNLKIFSILYQKVYNNNQYKQLYTMDNKFTSDYYSSRKIEAHYFKPEIS